MTTTAAYRDCTVHALWDGEQTEVIVLLLLLLLLLAGRRMTTQWARC